MSNTFKRILAIICGLVILTGAAFLIGKAAGGGGAIEKTVQFSITVNASGDFDLVVDPTEATCNKGDVLTFNITNTPSGGYDAQIQYVISGLPDGSYSLSVNPVNAGQATVLTVNTSLLISNSTYTCSVVGVDI